MAGKPDRSIRETSVGPRPGRGVRASVVARKRRNGRGAKGRREVEGGKERSPEEELAVGCAGTHRSQRCHNEGDASRQQPASLPQPRSKQQCPRCRGPFGAAVQWPLQAQALPREERNSTCLLCRGEPGRGGGSYEKMVSPWLVRSQTSPESNIAASNQIPERLCLVNPQTTQAESESAPSGQKRIEWSAVVSPTIAPVRPADFWLAPLPLRWRRQGNRRHSQTHPAGSREYRICP